MKKNILVIIAVTTTFISCQEIIEKTEAKIDSTKTEVTNKIEAKIDSTASEIVDSTTNKIKEATKAEIEKAKELLEK
jgi:vacuolar-type H+-ATPase subunit H